MLHTPGEIDLRYATPLTETGACAQPTAASPPDFAAPVVPGQPENSFLLMLMRSADERRMPLVGRSQVDTAGTLLDRGMDPDAHQLPMSED